MRPGDFDFASCLSEYAVGVSDSTSCSSTHHQSSNSCISPSSISTLLPSVLNSVTSLYRTTLVHHHSSAAHPRNLLITLTWCKTAAFQGLTLAFAAADPPASSSSSSSAVKLNTNSRLFRKLKGSKSLQFQGLDIEIFWDLSSARYGSGPEPLDGFYILITIDSHIALILGAAQEPPLRKLKSTPVVSAPAPAAAKSSLISRREHFSGTPGCHCSVYSTRARFCDGGIPHDVVIRCGGGGGSAAMMMSVCIDKKTVIRVKRLQWNFRGNQTIFLDGLLVDLMWDVHDWFYNNNNNNNSPSSAAAGGYAAVFMFRTRSGMDSRLWLEEKMLHKDRDDQQQDKPDFSLLILACKN